MAINRYSEESFSKVIRDHLSPSSTIKSPEHLKGREANLRDIRRAFNSKGKHVFIYGDRGVGKTSLAYTAAGLLQPSDQPDIAVPCESSNNCYSVIQNLISKNIKKQKCQLNEKQKLKINIGILSYELQQVLEQGIVPEISSVTEACDLLQYVSKFYSKAPIFVIDEFDLLPTNDDRKFFAELIKKISDDEIPVKFVLCGIGESLNDLIGAHGSIGRYLAPIKLKRLSHNAIWEIIQSAADALDVSINREYQIRIGLISDGFPSYAHLIGEKIFWEIFDDKNEITDCEIQHFKEGIKKASQEAETTLKTAYEKATRKYSDDYKEVLWALADTHELVRQVKEVYKTSYLRIINLRADREELEIKTFRNRINALKTERHGRIIIANGAGWFRFKENVIRGYVRLKAEEENISLGQDLPLEPASRKLLTTSSKEPKLIQLEPGQE